MIHLPPLLRRAHGSDDTTFAPADQPIDEALDTGVAALRRQGSFRMTILPWVVRRAFSILRHPRPTPRGPIVAFDLIFAPGAVTVYRHESAFIHRPDFLGSLR